MKQRVLSKRLQAHLRYRSTEEMKTPFHPIGIFGLLPDVPFSIHRVCYNRNINRSASHGEVAHPCYSLADTLRHNGTGGGAAYVSL